MKQCIIAQRLKINKIVTMIPQSKPMNFETCRRRIKSFMKHDWGRFVIINKNHNLIKK